MDDIRFTKDILVSSKSAVLEMNPNSHNAFKNKYHDCGTGSLPAPFDHPAWKSYKHRSILLRLYVISFYFNFFSFPSNTDCHMRFPFNAPSFCWYIYPAQRFPSWPFSKFKLLQTFCSSLKLKQERTTSKPLKGISSIVCSC